MSTLQSEVYDAFRSLGAPEDKALKAAEALGRRDTDVADLKRDVGLLKWMVGFVGALQVATFVKLFLP
jgi:hypothetical protein